MSSQSQRASRPWTKQEDNILRNAVAQFNQTETIDWHRVASHLPRRNNKECRKRWVYSLESKICKGPWDEEEDRCLKQGVTKYGLKWAAVAEVVGSRQPDQCSRRWHEVVNPKISHERWSLLEDEILKEAVDTYGRKWTEIVERFFPNRTPISARNRYKQRFEGRASSAKTSERPRQSSTSSDEQRKSSLLWTIQDHSQNTTPTYEHSAFMHMPGSATEPWELSASESINFAPDMGHVAPDGTFSQTKSLPYEQASHAGHRRTMSSATDLSMLDGPGAGSNNYGAAFPLEDMEFASASGEETLSSLGSTHAYPSPLMPAALMMNNAPAFHEPPFPFNSQQPNMQSPQDVVFSPETCITPSMTEVNFSEDELSRRLDSHTPMRESSRSGNTGPDGMRHGHSAPNLPSLAF